MKRYAFQFETMFRFSKPVSEQRFLLRCLPMESFFQQVSQENILITPSDTRIFISSDHFDNRTISGTVPKEHQEFIFSVTGSVLSGQYVLRQPADNLFLYPSAFTQAGLQIEKWNSEIQEGTVKEKVIAASELVFQSMQYLPDSTDVAVTAEQAAVQGQGVCQDYAHILLSLLRLQNIPARYCAGLLPGEGQTHAWVEYFNQNGWFAIDPTHNREIHYGYIKFSHGRDWSDCRINRGGFSEIEPDTQQEIIIKAKVEELPW